MIHLHTRSNYSLLHSCLKIEDIVAIAKQNNMPAIALCDEDVLFKAIEFHDLCRKNNIKPIIGLDKTIEELNFIFLAKNNEGYRQLIQLSQKQSTLDFDFSNLITILYPKEDKLKQALISKDVETLEQIKAQIQMIPSLYLGIINTQHSLDIEYNQFFKTSFDLPAVALSYILYQNKEDSETLDILNAIDLGYTYDDFRLPSFKGRYFRTEAEMKQLYSETELSNTELIASQCNVDLKLPLNSIPTHNEQSRQYLIELCNKGLAKRRNNKIEPIYQTRLDYELSVITKMGFENYFLVAWDVVLYAAKNNIYVGPGRGSSAGSLVAYCLGITKVDPIQYNITFERFLNASRATMPDIDIDFPDSKRETILDYVREKYGQDYVANIITFSTLKSKMCLRDVAKVLKFDSYEIESIVKFVTNQNDSLQQVITNNPKLQAVISKNRRVKQLFEIAQKIEDFPRHISTHASGIVIAQLPIEYNCPTLLIGDQNTTQLTMHYLERFGLIKFDFLGLKNLTIIEQTIENLELITNKKIDITKISINDKKTYDLLSSGNTLGIFQFESEGIKNVLRKIKPEKIEEVALVLALYRPGPLKNIPEFIKKKENPSLITYPDEKLKPVLQETLGIMVYQEQIMQVAQIMASFSLEKADNLRRAMSKKNVKEFDSLKETFIQNSVKNEYTLEKAAQIFDAMLEFSNYGFNKAHAYSYALLSYQMAFLKANAPACFYTSLLNSVIGNHTKTYQYLQEAKQMQLYVEKPNIRYSNTQYSINEHKVYFPLTGIKNIGIKTASLIIENRTHFDTYLDFVVFAVIQRINLASVESLIYAGALDCFDENRNTLIKNLSIFYLYGERILVKNKEGKLVANYHLLTKPELVKHEENLFEMLQKEKEVLGFYFSNHPFIELRKNGRYVSLSQIQSEGKYNSFITIDKIRLHTTKKGDEMCFIKASDESATLDFVVMPSVFKKHKDILKVSESYQVFLVKDNQESILIQSFKKIE